MKRKISKLFAVILSPTRSSARTYSSDKTLTSCASRSVAVEVRAAVEADSRINIRVESTCEAPRDVCVRVLGRSLR